LKHVSSDEINYYTNEVSILSVDGTSVRRNLLRFRPLSVSVYTAIDMLEIGIFMFIHAVRGSDLSPTYVDSGSNLVPQLLLLLDSIVF